MAVAFTAAIGAVAFIIDFAALETP